MLVKIIKSYREIVTICDSKLLGKKFEEGKFQLDVKESFYNGDEIPKEQVSKIIEQMVKEDAIFNIVGEESISLALNKGLINKENIKRIQNIPFSMILL